MTKIAVENTLGNVKQALQQNGFEVVDLDATQKSFVPDVQCCVISGQDKDVMGMADKQFDLPVINAEGASQEDIVQQVKQRVQMVNNARG